MQTEFSLEAAIEGLNKALQADPKNAEIHCKLAIALAEQGNSSAAIESYQAAINIEPRHIPALNNLGSIYRSLGRTEEALSVFAQVIKFEQNDVSAYVNLGSLFKEKGDISASEMHYRKALSLTPADYDANFNLANALRYEGDLNIAIECYERAIRVEANFPVAHYYLANALKDAGRMLPAINSYSEVISLVGDPSFLASSAMHMYRMSVAHKAECLYALDETVDLRQFIQKVTESDQSNIRLASLTAFIAHQYQEADMYPFCRDPLNWIKIFDIKPHFENFEESRVGLISYLNEIPQIWEPSNATTKKGYQTEDQLFNLQNSMLKKLEEVIKLKIDEYYTEFSSRSSVFTSRWPKQGKMKSWYVRLVQGGHQDAHMHHLGWLSGVVYLKTIKYPSNREGSIEFGLHGYDYKIINDQIPNKIHQPSDGDLVLFPSSLFHKTIPIQQNIDRGVIAFDLMPDP